MEVGNWSSRSREGQTNIGLFFCPTSFHGGFTFWNIHEYPRFVQFKVTVLYKKLQYIGHAIFAQMGVSISRRWCVHSQRLSALMLLASRN